ncbi:MAG: leucyl aminopeptidase family protein [Pseudomonadota bacterium]
MTVNDSAPIATEASRPIWLATEADAEGWIGRVPLADRAAVACWAQTHAFRAEAGRVLLLPAAGGGPVGVVVGLGGLTTSADLQVAHLQGVPDRLPAGTYHLADGLPPAAATRAALGWAIGRYRYTRYRSVLAPALPALELPAGADGEQVRRIAEADALARDLINTPAADLGPAELAAAVARVAARYGAQYREVVGEALLAAGFPAIHAVGRAAAGAPRLVELRAGQDGPRLTLVGKGVCFDTGGLDLKPAAGMALMKKDMGGAACALAVAQLVLAARLPVRLRLLIAAVENSVGGNAFRPGDVLQTRKGLSVEVTNTDAEGRLVLADALALADEERPDVLIDLATLTGAARVALGPELPALYSPDAALAASLAAAGAAVGDPLWPMPLWAGYEDELGSKIADLCNASSSGFAGSINAALFLRRFVAPSTPWLHLDLYGWNGKERPGRPVGGEAQTVRALYGWLSARYPGPAE